MIAPITQRYSELMRRVLLHYRNTATVKVHGVTYAGDGIDELIASWCTNASICATRDFVLCRDGCEVIGWHDHPRDMWVAESERAFFDELHRDGLIRYDHVNGPDDNGSVRR